MFLMSLNTQIEKEPEMSKFNPNCRNPKEAGMSCFHKASAVCPSLTILCDLLKDTSANALVVDNFLKTAAQWTPKTFLSSYKLVLRYEIRHFLRNLAISSLMRPGGNVLEHELDDDPSILQIDQSNRTIPAEVSVSAKASVGVKIRNPQTTTALRHSHLHAGIVSSTTKSLSETHSRPGESRFSIFSKREIDNEDVRQPIPVFKPTASIQRESGSRSVTTGTKIEVLSVKKIDASEMEVMSEFPKEESEPSESLLKLRRRLMEQLQTPLIQGMYTETPMLEQPLSLKIKNYSNYGQQFNINKYLLEKNPFQPVSKRQLKPADDCFTGPSKGGEATENSALQRIALQDRLAELLSRVPPFYAGNCPSGNLVGQSKNAAQGCGETLCNLR